MADSKLTFDADTASYDAKVAASHSKTEKLTDAFKEMAEPLLKVVSIAGTLELGIESIKARWEQWREQIHAAGEESVKVGRSLAATLGATGLLQAYPQIKKAVQESEGPLSTEQKTQAIGNFAGAMPGLTADQAIMALGQSQKAAQIIGPENIPVFAQALGLAMLSGVKQGAAGDMAIGVAQSGAHGLDAFQRAAGKFADENTTPEARAKADFAKYLANADSSVFGTRPAQVLGGQAVQARLAKGRPGELDIEAGAAGDVDETLKTQREIQSRAAGTASIGQKNYGDRAELEEEFQSLVERQRARGEHPYSGTWYRSNSNLRTAIAFMKDAEDRSAGIPAPAPFSTPAQGSEVTKHLETIANNTSQPAGAAKFRNESQDRDTGEE